MIEVMNAAERDKWEQQRVGGKRRYLLRNVIAWTLVICLPFLLIRIIVTVTPPAFPVRMGMLLGGTLILTVGVAAASWAWLSTRWDRSERNYQLWLSANSADKESEI